MSEKGPKRGIISKAANFIRNETGIFGVGLEGGFWGIYGARALQMLGIALNPYTAAIAAGAFVANLVGNKKGGKK